MVFDLVDKQNKKQPTDFKMSLLPLYKSFFSFSASCTDIRLQIYPQFPFFLLQKQTQKVVAAVKLWISYTLMVTIVDSDSFKYIC